MSYSQNPHILGSKLIGEQAQADQVLAATTPQLGDLARGIADRGGRRLVVDEVVVIAHEEVDDTGGESDVEGDTVTLTIPDTPEVQAAVASLETAVTQQSEQAGAQLAETQGADAQPSRAAQAARNKQAKQK